MARTVNVKKEMIFEAIGLSNMVRDRNNRKMYSVQYYDFDGSEEKYDEYKYFIVASIFPQDCITYKTKHGFHFISFTLFKNTFITKSKALGLTIFLDGQDYWCSQRDLILRISPKWKRLRLPKRFNNVSDKPKFHEVLSKPSRFHVISRNHLEFFHKFMALPKKVFNTYESCEFNRLDLKLYFYNARD